MSGRANYPGGFANGVLIRGVPIELFHPGEVFYVNNSTVLAERSKGGSNGNKGTYREPFETIDYAIGRCTASRGDIIVVMPGHVETVSVAAGIVLDVAGVAVIGLGGGTLRPKIVLGTVTTASIAVSAANVTMHNLIIEANFADVARGVDVTAKDFTGSFLKFQEAGANLNFVDYIVCSSTTDNNADRLFVSDCEGYGVDAVVNSPLLVNATLADLVFTKNRFNTDNAAALAMIQQATGKSLNNCFVEHNFYASLKTSGDILIDNDTATNDGWVAHNRAIHLDTAAEILVDCDGVGQFDNVGTGSVTASGYILPAIDS